MINSMHTSQTRKLSSDWTRLKRRQLRTSKMEYRARVLCIDDEPGVVELVSLILKSQNILVEGAEGGTEGLAMMRKNPPDAVLLDIMMPEMDGWEVYKQMRADETLKNVPVIILTARNSSFEEIIARERAGVNDYVTKPFVPNDLRSSLSRILGLATS
ncbi:MAG: two-component system response regulator [Anaerolineae bacterium]|nr:two-component system response regulator [Anaerolineae bacterium]